MVLRSLVTTVRRHQLFVHPNCVENKDCFGRSCELLVSGNPAFSCASFGEISHTELFARYRPFAKGSRGSILVGHD
jgi:hypothetical protein